MIYIKLYTPREIAGILKIHEETVRRYLREGLIEGKKIAGWKVLEQDLEEFVENPPERKKEEPEDPDFISTQKAADILEVSERTIQNYCNSGKLEAHKKDRSWEISKESVKQRKGEK